MKSNFVVTADTIGSNELWKYGKEMFYART